MSKKKPSKKVVQVVQAPPKPVVHGNVFATFMQEAQSLGNEVAARRELQNEVAKFLAEKELAEEFEIWRKERAPKS